MSGGLHIEMAAFKTLGYWLEGSGWTDAIINAGIATSGVADSLIKVAHLSRTRHAYQITAAALHILQHQAYDMYLQNVPNAEEHLLFTDWCEKMSVEQPQFMYWSLVLKLQLSILKLMGLLRSANVTEYVESLGLLIP